MSCGTDTTMLRLIVQDEVSKLLKDGTLQGGLLDCNDKPLPAQRNVLQCKELVDTTVTKFERIDRKLRITLSDKTELEVEIPELQLPTVKTKRYHATAQLVLAANECGTAQRVVVGYHPDDVRDPDATIPYADKDGTLHHPPNIVCLCAKMVRWSAMVWVLGWLHSSTLPLRLSANRTQIPTMVLAHALR